MIIPLSLVLLTFFALIGSAVLVLLAPKMALLNRLAWSPVLGMGVCLVITSALNRSGLPVGDFGLPLGAVLMVLALTVIALKALPQRRSLVPVMSFLVCSGLVCLWSALPSLRYGIDWFGNWNSDAGHYCLSASRMLQHGFYDVPPTGSLVGGQDKAQVLWYLHAVFGHRAGTDHLLAFASALLQRTPVETYMALTVCCQAALVTSVAALGQGRLSPMLLGLTSLICLCSYWMLEGVLMLLIGQLFGLANLALAVEATYRLLRRLRHSSNIVWPTAVLTGIAWAALILAYPEILPLGLVLCTALVAVHGLSVRRAGLPFSLRAHLGTTAAAVAVTAVLAGPYLLDALHFILFQVGTTDRSASSAITLFSQFLKPEGMPLFLGWCNLSDFARVPDALILGAPAVIGVLGLMTALRTLRRPLPLELITSLFFSLGILFILKGSDFGSFKAVFFVVPFLCALLGVVTHELWRRGGLFRWCWIGILLGAILVPNAMSSGKRMEMALKDTFTEAPGSTKAKAISAIATAQSQGTDASFVWDSSIPPGLVKTHASQLSGVGFEGITGRYFWESFAAAGIPFQLTSFHATDDPRTKFLAEIRAHYLDMTDLEFPGLDGLITAFRPRAEQSAQPRVGRIIVPPPQVSILNRSRPSSITAYALVPTSTVQDYLVQIDGTGARSYFSPEKRRIGLHIPEDDPHHRRRPMSAIGNGILFEVLNPTTPKVRLLLNLTGSFGPFDDRSVGEFTLYGQETLPMPSLGAGELQIVTEPITPLQHVGRYYLYLEFRRPSIQIPTPASEARNRLWRKDLRADWRYVNCWARNISVLPMDWAPTSSRFPAPSTEERSTMTFSGVFEDGWCDRTATFTLAGEGNLRVSGRIQGQTSEDRRPVTVRFLGQSASHRRILPNGPFEIRVPCPPGTKVHTVEIVTEAYHPVGGADLRLNTFILDGLSIDPVGP